MNQQAEFMSEAFHALAQPIMAMRATAELGIARKNEHRALQKALSDCMGLIDRLMQEMAILREIASLEEAPMVRSCDGRALLQSCADEMVPVAGERGIAICVSGGAALMKCNEPMFQRALFILLDEMIASAGRDKTISLDLRNDESSVVFEVRAFALQGLRQRLFERLMIFAGGRILPPGSDCTAVAFSKCAL